MIAITIMSSNSVNPFFEMYLERVFIRLSSGDSDYLHDSTKYRNSKPKYKYSRK
jgi:hypothetical protein